MNTKTDEDLKDICSDAIRAVREAVEAPLLARIAELEAERVSLPVRVRFDCTAEDIASAWWDDTHFEYRWEFALHYLAKHAVVDVPEPDISVAGVAGYEAGYRHALHDAREALAALKGTP